MVAAHNPITPPPQITTLLTTELLVSRFRSSHHFAAPSLRTSESKDTSNLLISCGFGSEVRISNSGLERWGTAVAWPLHGKVPVGQSRSRCDNVMLSWPTLTPLMRTRSALPGKEAENTARAYYRRGTSLPSPRHHRHRQSIPRTTRSASGRGRERQFRLVGKLDVDLKRRDIPSSLHAD